jgi:putative DNA primase/helicase
MSGAQNYDDVLDQLRAAGLIVEQIDFGRVVRCKIEGDREKRGWYALHEVTLSGGSVMIFGSYGVWRGNENNAQKIEIKKTSFTDQQRDAIRARIAEDKLHEEARRKRELERAAQRAGALWSRLEPTGECAYLERKAVKPYGVRFSKRGNMVLPMLDERGRIHGLQVIYAKPRNGIDKKYWPPGTSHKHRYFAIGAPTWIILIAEGYATAASLHEATGYPVAVAFVAGNLLNIAQLLHKRYPWAKILVCADDDAMARCKSKDCAHIDRVELVACPKCGTPYGHGNTGVDAAAAAALAIGGAWTKPEFFPGTDLYTHTDFNDLHRVEGLHAVRSQVEAKVVELKWFAMADLARESLDGGVGENKNLKSLLTVEEAAARYSLVYGGRGTLFDHQEHDLVPKPDVLDMLEDHGWREWKRHRARRVVRLAEVGFDPSMTDETIRCNLWGGWPTTPKEGNCNALLELLEFLCSEEKGYSEIYNWVLKWLAYPIQHHGAKMKTALVFHGPQGAGKNMFFEAVMAIYGRYGRIVDQNAIEDKFNDWASKKLFLIADEVVARQELFHTKNKLKGFITGDWIRINPKNVAAHEERNHLNVVFLSNEIQPVIVEQDDRRYTAIYTPPKVSKDFYEHIKTEIDAGAIAALHHHLLHLDLGNFKPWTAPPMTQAKRELIGVSLDSTQRFLEDWRNEETPYPFGPVLSMDLYQAYLRWCRTNGVQRPRESNQFLAYVGKIRGWTNQPRHVHEDAGYGASRPKRVVIPDEESLARVKKNCGESEQQSHWLTNNVLDFKSSLEEHGRQ